MLLRCQMMFFYLQIKVLVYKVTEHLSFKFTTKVLLWHSSPHSLFDSLIEHRSTESGGLRIKTLSFVPLLMRPKMAIFLSVIFIWLLFSPIKALNTGQSRIKIKLSKKKIACKFRKKICNYSFTSHVRLWKFVPRLLIVLFE